MAPDPPISFCTLRGSSYKRSVPMLFPSNGDVLARALVNKDGMISSQVAYAISFKELVKTTFLQLVYKATMV